MAEDRDALIEHYRAARADLLAAIEGLDEAQLRDPSIDGWSVKDHLAHIAMWDDLRAAEITRVSAGHDAAWRLTNEQDEALNALAYEARRAWSLEQASDELDRAHGALLDAIVAATPRGLESERYGSAPVRSGHYREHAGWVRRWRAERGI